MSDMEAGVRQLLGVVLGHLKESCPVFEVAEIVPTGSFYEGTKLGASDEFDFILTLAKLSKPDGITLQPGCSVWYPNIKLQAGVEFPEKLMLSMFSDGEYREKEFLGDPRLLVEEFWKEIEKVIDL